MENDTQLFRKIGNNIPNSTINRPARAVVDNKTGGGDVAGSTNTEDCDEGSSGEDNTSSKLHTRTFIRIPVPFPSDNPLVGSLTSINPNNFSLSTTKSKYNHQNPKKSKHNNLQLQRRSSLSAELEGSSGGITSSSQESLIARDSPSSIDDQHVFVGSRKSRDRQEKIKTKSNSTTHKYNQDFKDVVGDYGNVSSLSTHHNVHSSMSLLSMSTNNAITIAPSRNSILEPNVFDTTGGRHHHHNHHKRHNNYGHGGRRRRSKTPELVTMSRNSNSNNGNSSINKQSDLQSVLNRLDDRIKNNFGDWSNMDDDTNFEYRSIGRIPGQGGHGGVISNHTPWMNSSKVLNGSVSLPPLYKNYQTVLKSSKGKLLDKTQRVAMSKDNNDPNSILSEAKRTLTQMDAVGSKMDI